MDKYAFKNISIRGRVAYGISCLNTYLNTIYPDKDFSSLMDMACKITEDGNYIDVSTLAFMEIIPQYLYEFDNYKDAEFEYISEDQYNSFVSLIPKDDSNLNSIMLAIHETAYAYCYVSVEKNAPDTYPHLESLISIMNKLSLPLPDISLFKKYSFEESGGWGNHIKRSEYL